MSLCTLMYYKCSYQGRIQDFKLGRAHLKKFRRAEGDAKIVGVFRAKIHDFTPKNLIFSNFRGARAGYANPGSTPGYYEQPPLCNGERARQ
jgi:hypothetical protein